MKIKNNTVVLLLAMLTAAPAHSASVEQLRCLDDKLNEQQRGGIAQLFAEQPANPKDAVIPGKGTAGAARDFGYAMSSCTSQFGWSRSVQNAATQYLIRNGQLAQITLKHTSGWSWAVERSAPFGATLLAKAPSVTKAKDGAEEGGPTEHIKAMMLGNAISNGAGAVTKEHQADVIAYVVAWAKREDARKIFAAAK